MAPTEQQRIYYILRAPSGYLGKSQTDGSLIFGLQKMEHAYHIASVAEVKDLMAKAIHDTNGAHVEKSQIAVLKIQETVTRSIEEISI